MTAPLSYILKWALCLAMLYIPFALLLKKETFATFNRILLLGIIAVSAILPMIVVTYPIEIDVVKIVDSTIASATDAPQAVTAQGDVAQASLQVTDTESQPGSIIPTGTLLIIYIAVAGIALILRLAEIARIIRGIKRCTVADSKHNGMTLHCHTGEVAPFSWFGHIVISKSDYEECGKEILLHEEGHYRHGHSWDMLLLGVVKALQWFNPFAYMLANDMKEIHEYEADRYVLEHHGNAGAYQLLLLKKAVGDTAFNLANNFNQSSVRKRIIMMARLPSAKINKGKIFAFAPVALLFLFIFARPEYVYSIIEERVTPAAEPPVITEKPTASHPAVESTPIPLQTATVKIEKPMKRVAPLVPVQFNDVGKRLIERHEEHATETYYELVNITDSELGELFGGMDVRQCSARIEFIADKEGNAHSITSKSCNISIAGSLKESGTTIEDCKREATEAIERYVRSKKWMPAMEQGRSISTIYDAHIVLGLEDTGHRKLYGDNHTMMVGSTPIN